MRHVLLCFALAFLPAGQVDDLSFDSEGVPIRFTVEGEGEETLVLLHGYAANLDLFRMAGLVAAFADRYQIVSVDARGHGKSGKPHEPEAYGLEMVEDVVRLLDFLEIERAHVLGYSMGGMITAKLVTTHPERLLSAVVGGYGWPEPEPPGSGLMERVAESLERGEGFGPLFRELTPEGDPPMSEAEIHGLGQVLLATNDPLALAAAARGFRELALSEEELRANEVPTLAVVGERDPLAADVRRMDGVMNELEIVVVEGADHMTTGMSPAFRSHVRRFLEANAVATPAAVSGD